MLTSSTDLEGTVYSTILTTSNGVDFISFPANLGNPDYEQFLVQTNLTDGQAQGLTPNVWN